MPWFLGFNKFYIDSLRPTPAHRGAKSSSGGMVLEVLGGWSTGVAAAETVADAGVSVSGASHGVVGWSGGCERRA